MTATQHGFSRDSTPIVRGTCEGQGAMNHSLRAGEKTRSHVPSGVTTGASSTFSFFTCIGFTSTSS